MIERLFWGYLPVVRAGSLMEYTPNSCAQRLLESIKYGGRSDIAVEMGRMMGETFSRRHFFDGIDCIQPVPLHPNRRAQRGYNQSEELARGIAEVVQLPIANLVRRTADNVSQTTLSHTERIDNVKDIFTPNTSELQRRRPRHVLFVDDVITTGSTLISCVQAVVGSPEERRAAGPAATDGALRPKVSLLSLAYAGRFHPGFRTPEELHHPLQTYSNEHFRTLQQNPNII